MPQLWITDAGGTPRLAKELHVNDAGVNRKLKELWITDAGGTPRKVFSGGGTLAAINASPQANASGGGLKTLSLNVKRDGTWTITATGATPTNPPLSGIWVSPAGAGAGDPFHMRVDLVAGDAFSGGDVVGAWLSSSGGDRQWTLNCPPSDTRDNTFTIAFSSNAGATTAVVGTVYFSMTDD